MSMMNFAGALGGQGPPPDMGTVPPPDGGTSPDTSTPGGQFSTSLEALDAADDALHAFVQLDPDDADRAEASKALQIVLKLKATNQQDTQAGGMKSLQRALAGAPVG